MKIGILMTGHAAAPMEEAQGDYDAMFARLLDGHGFAFERYDVVDGHYPASPLDADGWLITGSKHGAYEAHPWIAPLERFIRETHAAGRPLVGICFGHQIIAQALGGRVEKFSGGWSVGPTRYRIEGRTFELNAWHQDQVVAPPPGVQVVGSSDFCANAALLYGDRAYSIQPHPEFDAEIMDILITHRGRGTVPDELLERARSGLDKPLANGEIAERIAGFFKRSA